VSVAVPGGGGVRVHGGAVVERQSQSAGCRSERVGGAAAWAVEEDGESGVVEEVRVQAAHPSLVDFHGDREAADAVEIGDD
jgi:hypothetical protein